MKILDFAKLNGVTFEDCGTGWGGRIGYRTSDYPSCMMAGYRNKTEAAEAWLTELGLNEKGVALLRKALEAAP